MGISVPLYCSLILVNDSGYLNVNIVVVRLGLLPPPPIPRPLLLAINRYRREADITSLREEVTDCID